MIFSYRCQEFIEAPVSRYLFARRLGSGPDRSQRQASYTLLPGDGERSGFPAWIPAIKFIAVYFRLYGFILRFFEFVFKCSKKVQPSVQ
jgi:hypothetical protein